jgi:hypothetical protein
MDASSFDEFAFFQALAASGVRALLIGRRALVLLGLPVLTADYDFWLAIEDIATFNAVCEPFDLHPTRSPEEARASGRYVIENDEHIDVLVARSVPTLSGDVVTFESLWSERQPIAIDGSTTIWIPNLDGLIATKRIAARPKDLEDIRLLEALRKSGR